MSFVFLFSLLVLPDNMPGIISFSEAVSRLFSHACPKYLNFLVSTVANNFLAYPTLILNNNPNPPTLTANLDLT